MARWLWTSHGTITRSLIKNRVNYRWVDRQWKFGGELIRWIARCQSVWLAHPDGVNPITAFTNEWICVYWRRLTVWWLTNKEADQIWFSTLTTDSIHHFRNEKKKWSELKFAKTFWTSQKQLRDAFRPQFLKEANQTNGWVKDQLFHTNPNTVVVSSSWGCFCYFGAKFPCSAFQSWFSKSWVQSKNVSLRAEDVVRGILINMVFTIKQLERENMTGFSRSHSKL